MRKLTILVLSFQEHGHLNACLGALQQLPPRGHRVIFAVREEFLEKAKSRGYETHLLQDDPEDDKTQTIITEQELQELRKLTDPSRGKLIKRFAEFQLQHKLIGDFTALEKMKAVGPVLDNKLNRLYNRKLNLAFKRAVESVKPDLLYQDGNFFPASYLSGIPYIKQYSGNPIYTINHPELPPGGSGLPTKDPTDWHLFDEVRQKLIIGMEPINRIMENVGLQPFESEFTRQQLNTEILTVYAFPEELNYPQIRESTNWFNMEVFNKTVPANKVSLNTLVPEEFLNDSLDGKFSGKFIYVMMGSISSAELNLMNRLIGALGKTNHKYIVSKGPLAEEIQLHANMWGAEYLPQTSLIPHMNLVITHGGNNTVTETFAIGVPMLVMPQAWDQYDNAQRLQETRLGARLDPYKYTDKEMSETIDRLLNDQQLKGKLQSAAQRIQQTDKHEELACMIEQLFKGYDNIVSFFN